MTSNKKKTPTLLEHLVSLKECFDDSLNTRDVSASAGHLVELLYMNYSMFSITLGALIRHEGRLRNLEKELRIGENE
jgi:hypothetical protein